MRSVLHLTLRLIGLTLVTALPAVHAQDLPLHFEGAPLVSAGTDSFFGPIDVGDVTADGRTDFLIAVSTQALLNSGYALQLLSGADGQFVDIVATANFSGIVQSSIKGVAGVGDLDGDGHAEIAYAQIINLSFGGAGDLDLFLRDGLGGNNLWVRQLRPAPQTARVAAVVSMGDLDGDGGRDLAVHVVGNSLPVTESSSSIAFLNGATGSLIFELFDHDHLIESIVNVGDTNGDGFDDLLAGAPTSPFVAPEAGGAVLVSGANFQYLRFWNGDAAMDHFASGVAAPGDVNADGFADLLIVDPADDVARVYSGLDNTVLQTQSLGVAGAYSYRLIQRDPFDYNGDGRDDYLFWTTAGTTPTVQRIRSGADFSVLAETDRVVLGDVNGDRLPELIENQIGNLQAVPPQPTSVSVFAHKGAQAYGNGSGLLLSWEPDPSRPERGDFTMSGGTPFATALVAGSQMAADTLIFGTNFPLLVSPAPADLFLQVTTTLDAQGELRAPVSLTQPALAGTVLFYQWAELSPNAATSNGLQLLFDL